MTARGSSRALVALLALLALLVLAGACGGERSAHERWIEAAAKACDTRAAAVQVASAQLTAQSTRKQFATFFTTYFEPAYRTQLDAMRAARPPDDAARALVDDTAAVIAKMATDPGSFAVAVDPFADVDARWDAYGLRQCGSRSDGSGTLSSSSS